MHTGATVSFVALFLVLGMVLPALRSGHDAGAEPPETAIGAVCNILSWWDSFLPAGLPDYIGIPIGAFGMVVWAVLFGCITDVGISTVQTALYRER